MSDTVADYSYTRSECLMSIENLGVHYDRPILRGINLKIYDIVRPNLTQGQVVTILGPSGIGKTQLLRCIAGLQSPATGTVSIQAEHGDKHVHAGDVGMVGQHYPLFNHRTVVDNLLIAAKRANKTREAVDHYLGDFKLADQASKYPMQLSGGQRQRVAIIQQLLNRSRFLVMDEPFSGLDPQAKQMVCDTLLTVSQKHEWSTTIVISHDIDAAIYISDTICVLGRTRDGQGQPLPGATIVDCYDLMEMGLAWRPDKQKLPQFATLRENIIDRFKTLL
ncbi:ATP-binding cassette domain-containing protein [Caballeronia sp. ATUFL_F1_KS4A]|uniref:ABC transporter ATP-binding protein n=1 Tax=Caballeronia sp. ATUFL_F1_KS4A TaxID=2921768 RepID=UPI002028F494|nr:ATP-binding cassette domain-containing protein [Caballeronia sp. ATUFL_F1_KS4A]